jgi:hypothetical protein
VVCIAAFPLCKETECKAPKESVGANRCVALRMQCSHRYVRVESNLQRAREGKMLSVQRGHFHLTILARGFPPTLCLRQNSRPIHSGTSPNSLWRPPGGMIDGKRHKSETTYHDYTGAEATANM